MRRQYVTLSRTRTLVSIVSVVLCLAGVACASDSLTIAAAADLSDPLKEIAVGFERQTSIHLSIVTGSSGNLYEQIRNGAPFEIYMSADTDYPRKLVDERRADAASLRTYAVGILVLAVRADSQLTISSISSVLTDPSVRELAIANPKTAPYGRAAVQALKSLGLYDKVSAKLVIGENVSQASQFLESGNAQVAFIALSRAVSPGIRERLKFTEVPQSAYEPIRQSLVVLDRAKKNPVASEFLKYLNSPEANAILQRYGFTK